MYRAFLSLALLAHSVTVAYSADDKSSSQSWGWQTTADCAAGYLANWQNRLSDPNRSHSMSDSIQTQFEDFAAAAARSYQSEMKSSAAEAQRSVESYIRIHVDHFVAMDRAGALESFLDTCPQIDDSTPD